MSAIRTVLVFAGFATGLSLLLGAISGAVKAEVERARNSLFEIGPNCEWIRFKGFGDDATEGLELDAHIAQARTYYFGPMISQLKVEGLGPAQIRVRILEDLFPSCQWPPEDMLSTKGLIWAILGNWVEIEAMRGELCDPLLETPSGLVCAPLTDGSYVLERENL